MNHITSRRYFRNKICFECAQTGHRKRNYQKPKKINAVLSKVMKNNGKRKYVDMKVNGRNITCLLEHKSHVREVFKRIEKYGFKVGLEKCEFCMKKNRIFGSDN